MRTATKAYDVIWTFHVIEHLSNPLHFIRSAAAALEQNGLFYLGLPFYSRGRILSHQFLYKIGIANYPSGSGCRITSLTLTLTRCAKLCRPLGWK